MRKMLFVLGLTLVGAGLLAAAPRGAIVRVEGEVVTVNRGEQDQVKRGDRWFVYHNGQPAAELQVEQVGEYSSLARITRRVGAGVSAGDIVNGQAFQGGGSPARPAISGGVEATSLPGVIPQTGGPPDAPPPAIAAAKPPIATKGLATVPSTQDLKELEERYKEKFETRTQSRDFSQLAGAPRSHDDIYPGMDLMNAYMNVDMLLSSFVGGNFYGDPATLLMTVGSGIASSQARSRLYEAVDAKVQIQVTYWDETLMNAYGDYVAVSEGKGSLEKMLQIKNSLINQKGVNRNRVFEVRVRNIGKVQGQLSPFHWHIFMAGPSGAMIKPERYDTVLDRSLNPGQEVNGNVYFPNGELEAGKVTICLEDIFGDRGQLEFPNP